MKDFKALLFLGKEDWVANRIGERGGG